MVDELRPIQIRETQIYATFVICLLAMIVIFTVGEMVIGPVPPPGVVSGLLIATGVLPFIVRTGTTINPRGRTATTWIGILMLPVWRRRSVSIATAGTVSLWRSERMVGRTGISYCDIHVPTDEGDDLVVGGRRSAATAVEIAAHIGGTLDLQVDRMLR